MTIINPPSDPGGGPTSWEFLATVLGTTAAVFAYLAARFGL